MDVFFGETELTRLRLHFCEADLIKKIKRIMNKTRKIDIKANKLYVSATFLPPPHSHGFTFTSTAATWARFASNLPPTAACRPHTAERLRYRHLDVVSTSCRVTQPCPSRKQPLQLGPMSTRDGTSSFAAPTYLLIAAALTHLLFCCRMEWGTCS